jgi:hypothetical protein
MPEPPPPTEDLPLYTWFPFGPVVHFTFSTADALLEGKFWPALPPDVEKDPALMYWWPFGPPVHILLTITDLMWGLFQ